MRPLVVDSPFLHLFAVDSLDVLKHVCSQKKKTFATVLYRLLVPKRDHVAKSGLEYELVRLLCQDLLYSGEAVSRPDTFIACIADCGCLRAPPDCARQFPPNQSGWPMFFALMSSFSTETVRSCLASRWRRILMHAILRHRARNNRHDARSGIVALVLRCLVRLSHAR